MSNRIVVIDVSSEIRAQSSWLCIRTMGGEHVLRVIIGQYFIGKDKIALMAKISGSTMWLHSAS